MTGVITVSATTAAYAAEPIKPAHRVTGGHLMEAAMKDWAEKASQTDDPRQKVLLNLVHPPALALFFLTTGDQQKLPQSSREVAEAAYAQNMGVGLPELAETAPAQAAVHHPEPDQGEDHTPIAPESDASQSQSESPIPDDVFLPPA